MKEPAFGFLLVDRLGTIPLSSGGDFHPVPHLAKEGGMPLGKPRTLDIGATSRQGSNGEGVRKRVE